MAYTLLQIAASYDRPRETTRRHIKELETKGHFKKLTPGKQYNDAELKKLEKLMGFTFRVQK